MSRVWRPNRSRRTGPVMVLVIGAAAMAGCSSDEGSDTTTSERDTGAPPPTAVDGAPSTTTAASPADAEWWDVVEVIDGDTLDVVRGGESARVRVIGINAPERDECFYDEAAAGFAALIPAEGVRLVADVTDLDRFGRLLRFVETADGVDLGGLLVESGLARSQLFPPDTSRNARYDQLQETAMSDGAGFWAPDACGGGAPVDGVQIGIELQYDAPGDDNDNLNEEWVTFTNEGAAALDLSGWQVADESSSHRYPIDDLVLDPGASFVLYTGCGTDGPLERYWCNTTSAVWNNSGDTVFLNDPAGNIVTSYTYRGD